jgi:pyrroloquinoline quinone biosynthesis protein D
MSHQPATFFIRMCPRLVKRARLRTDPVSGDPVLLSQEKIILLNRSGFEILSLCDGTRSIEQIIQHLETRYPGVATTLANEVPKYIKEIGAIGLIEWKP